MIRIRAGMKKGFEIGEAVMERRGRNTLMLPK